MNSKVQPDPIPLADAVEAILDTAIRRAHRVLKTAETSGTTALRGHSKRIRVGDVDVRLDLIVRGAHCAVPVPDFDSPRGWGDGPMPALDEQTCKAVRPGCGCGQGIAPGRLPCMLRVGHQGRHTDAFGRSWPVVVAPVEAGPTRADVLAARALVARRTLDDIKATDIGTAAWNTLLYERAALVSALSVLLDAIDEAQA